MKQKITKRTIEQIMPVSKETVVYDTEVKGLHLKLYPSGKASFHLYYRTPDRIERRPKLGQYPAMTPELARSAASEMLLTVMSGKDPKSHKELRNHATVSSAVAAYISRREASAVKPKTLENYRWLYRAYIQPEIGSQKLSSWQREDVAHFHRKLRNTPTTANQAVRLLRSAIQEAIDFGDIPLMQNPCVRIKPFPTRKIERYLTEAETERLLDALEHFETAQTAPITAIAAIRLLFISGCRKNEILTLKWQNISYEEKCLQLEDSKTGSKRVPMSDQAIAILRSLESHKCSDYVIAGKHPSKPLQGLQKVWERIRGYAGLEDVRLHDLRHNFASQLLSAGHELAVIGRVLGHKSMASTHRYAHLSDHSVRAALSDFDEMTSRVKTNEKV